MPTCVSAHVLREPQGSFELVDGIELADPRPGEVLVRCTSTGLCHTDLFARDVFHQPDFPPAIYGHEGTGVVEQVGPGVTDVAEGDRVMASYTSCGQCRTCLTGRPFNCERFNDVNFALAHGDGSYKDLQLQVYRVRGADLDRPPLADQQYGADQHSAES